MLKVLSSILIFCSLQIANAKVDFKTNRIKKEYKTLKKKNPELYQIVKYVEFQALHRFKKNIVITEIYRTEKEQRRYYKKYFISPHQRWLAVDIRTRNFTKEQIKTLVSKVNEMFEKSSRYIPTAFYHNIGLGHHIHIQFKERK